MIFLETVAPGRVASGEAFAFEELRWATDLRVGDRLLVRERYRLTPEGRTLAALRARFAEAYWGSAFLLLPGITARSPLWDDLHAQHGPDLWVGVTALAGGDAFAVRMVAADSLVLRRFCRMLRERVYNALGRPAPDLRRPW